MLLQLLLTFQLVPVSVKSIEGLEEKDLGFGYYWCDGMMMLCNAL